MVIRLHSEELFDEAKRAAMVQLTSEEAQMAKNAPIDERTWGKHIDERERSSKPRWGTSTTSSPLSGHAEGNRTRRISQNDVTRVRREKLIYDNKS
jgi:hypothetical protein